jgi:ABC-type transport system involved in multi-copper enzyme maturation permease subunit
VKRILTIAALTWKAAFRFRLFLVIVALLLAAVVGLPLLIKDDGTARGFTQILLTYTLSTITGLLGLATLWLACGTLARDIEESQIQMVVVKPIARWQVWLGKWLGLLSLNAAVLAIAGTSVFVLLQWRATKLPANEQRILQNEVLVARASARPPTFTKEIEAETDVQLKKALERTEVPAADIPQLRMQIKEGLKAYVQNVPPGYEQSWAIDLGFAKNFIRNQPLYLRVKFNTAEKSPSGTFPVFWRVGVPRETQYWQSEGPLSLAPDTFHEFEVPAGLFDDKGVLTVTVMNPNNVSLLFTMEEGVEVLYREGGFALNFARGLGIIFCWMALLATLGLAAASFLSFPVAAFVAIAALLVVFSAGTLAATVAEGTIMTYNQESGERGSAVLDFVAIPLFKGILAVVNLARDFSPIDSLSSGRSVTWLELLRAFTQIVLVLGGAMATFGIWAFSRRELALPQNH